MLALGCQYDRHWATSSFPHESYRAPTRSRSKDRWPRLQLAQSWANWRAGQIRAPFLLLEGVSTWRLIEQHQTLEEDARTFSQLRLVKLVTITKRAELKACVSVSTEVRRSQQTNNYLSLSQASLGIDQNNKITLKILWLAPSNQWTR